MERVCLGKVVKLHGFMGQMKIRTQYDDDFKIKDIKKLYDEQENEFLVTKIFQTKDGVVVALEGVGLEQANAYIGSNFYIDRELIGDKILIEDLKNSKVILDNGEEIGVILDVNDYGSAEVFSVKKSNGKEIMFPNVKGLISKFELKDKILILNLDRFKEVSDEN